MISRLQQWLHTLPTFSDPIERRQAPFVQVVLLLLIALSALCIPLALVSPAPSNSYKILTVSAIAIVLFAHVAGLVTLRRGYFELTILLMSFSLLLCLTLIMVPNGLNNSWPLAFSFCYPITIAGLLAPRWLLWLVSLCVVVAVTVIGLLGAIAPTMVGYATPGLPFRIDTLFSFALLALFLTLCFDQFGKALREAVLMGHHRELELERVREAQETLIEDRTTELRTALASVGQREQLLSQTLGELHASQEAVRELSAPVMPVLPGVLVAPMVGTIDTARAEALTHNTLRAVEQERAQYVIFDITGVPVVDTQVAQVLLQTASAARLLGAEVILVGVRPEVAQTMVSLGIELRAFATHADLRGAVVALLRKDGWVRADQQR